MSAHELEAACTALIHPLRERAADAEKNRCVPAETIRELTALGLFRSLTPKSHGGDELPAASVFRSCIELGRGCTSTCWVSTLLSVHSFIGRCFDRSAQNELWASSPDTLIASSVAPQGAAKRVDGGFQLSGRWSFLSGVDHAAWAMLCSMVKDEAMGKRPLQYFFLVPAADYVIEDDWFVSGLRASGSKSVRLDDRFVPAHRAKAILSIMDTALPWNSLFNLIFSAPAIGTALAMKEEFKNYLRTRRAAYTGDAYKEKPAAWLRIAESSAEIDGARLMLQRDLQEIDARVAARERLPHASTDRIAYDGAYIVQSCARAADRLFSASGGRALYETSPLQRLFRDMHANTQHAAADLDVTGERYGRALIDASGA